MLGLGADRKVCRDRQPRRLCLAGKDAAGARHHGGLRPAQERERERTSQRTDGARDRRDSIGPTGAHAAMTPALNPALDIGAIASTYARDGRVHIPAILTDASAVRVLQCLMQETDFSLLCQTGTDQAAAWRV